jgi:ABC-type multidrug transport system permease subunit
MIRRIFALLQARSIEFLRDRSSLAWAVLMPLLIVFVVGYTFSKGPGDQFTVGMLADAGSAMVSAEATPSEAASTEINVKDRHPLFDVRFIRFLPIQDTDAARKLVAQHQIDLLLAPGFAGGASRYWINPDSASGYLVEQLLLQLDPGAVKQVVSGEAVRYVDWVLPGVLSMGMMFGCFFGVGHAVVQYRRTGFLKRLRATPLSAFEFITAQVLSRLILTIATAIVLFLVVRIVLGIAMEGSYLALFLVAMTGGCAFISLGLLVASRASNTEVAGGILNLIGWPMILLSGVFFSLEGRIDWLREVAQYLPLSQMLTGARAVMIEGADMLDIVPQIRFLAGTSVVLLAVACALFHWRVT